MDDLTLARALHVVAVVIWIGGVAFVALALLPELGREKSSQAWHVRFLAYERQFAWVARIMVLAAGASGFYLVVALDAWSRFCDIAYWWMHAMVIVWAAFAVMLFVLEPLVFDRLIVAKAQRDPAQVHKLLTRFHWILLIASLVAIFGAVAGSHGAFL